MSRTDELAAEIAALEKEISGNPAKAAAPNEASVKAEEEHGAEPAKATETPAAPVSGTGDATPDSQVDWEKRFKNFKASSDATVHGLRKEVLALREELQRSSDAYTELNKRMNELTSKAPADINAMFSEEEREIIGEETLIAMQKAQAKTLEAQLKPLQEQLEKEREYRRKMEEKALEQERAGLQQTFIQKLATLCPEYAELDTNPKFHAWMDEPDVASGYPRIQIFKRAQAAGDVGRVAEFFLQFRDLSKPKNKLAGKVTPVSGGTGQVVREKAEAPEITREFIDKFYDDSTKGVYRGRFKEQQEIQKRIDDHLRKLAAGMR
jgi:hypothetical protein